MGWKRINGREYYYESERHGDRVETRYCGAGAVGLRAARRQERDRRKREAESEKRRTEREESKAAEQAIADWFNNIQSIADAAMIAAGFHKHKGQWRRKRR